MFQHFNNCVERIECLQLTLSLFTFSILYHLILDLKQFILVDPPYLNAQISYLSDSEEDVKSS